MKFYGRTEELEALREEIRLSGQRSRMTVVTGRRRVGKTRLLLKAAEESGRPTLYFFCRRKYAEEPLAAEWLEAVCAAFGLGGNAGPRRLSLVSVIRFVMELSREKPCNLIIDECQELDWVVPSFWADLQCAWDLGKESSRVWLAMIGSKTAMMRRIFDDASEPLFGRQDLSLTLKPFSPGLLREIFLDFAPNGTPDDLLTLYAVTGGVARYVEFLADSGPLTREAIVNLVFSARGGFLRTDGETLLANEFRMESSLNESVLRAVARGATKWAELADILKGQNISGCMDRLEKRYGMLRKVSPMFSESPKGVRYEIRDPYFRFWFRFVEPSNCQSLAESGNWEALRRLCLAELDHFSGRTLEGWFREVYAASPRWTRTGRWWDRKGQNEIDLIALNELDGRAEIIEVKRNPSKIDLGLLRSKAIAFEQACGRFAKGCGEPRLRGLSLEDMLKDPAEEP